MANSKVCTKCQQELPLDRFCLNRAKKDLKNNICRACAAAYSHAHPEQNRIRSAKWTRAHMEHRHEYLKAYYQQHKEHIESLRRIRIARRKSELSESRMTEDLGQPH